MTGRDERRAAYGDLVEYGAAFRGRERATNLARKWQENGVPSFVYFDPNKVVPAPRAAIQERGVAEARGLQSLEITGVAGAEDLIPVVVAELDESGRPRKGMWVIEQGIPTETERELLGAGLVDQIDPSEALPRDPKKRKLLYFPPATTFGAVDDRPNIIDALVYEARLLPDAEPQAPCKCATDPETGKRFCSRQGAIGMLSQEQVLTVCSTIEPVGNGRVGRAKALREAQAICGALVEGIDDSAARTAARFDCLSGVLSQA